MPRVVSATFIAIGEVQGGVFEVIDGLHMLPLERPREFGQLSTGISTAPPLPDENRNG